MAETENEENPSWKHLQTNQRFFDFWEEKSKWQTEKEPSSIIPSQEESTYYLISALYNTLQL